MRCPVCNSDQVNMMEVRPGFHYVECVNCDHEGYEDTASETIADAIDMITAHKQFIRRQQAIAQRRKQRHANH